MIRKYKKFISLSRGNFFDKSFLLSIICYLLLAISYMLYAGVQEEQLLQSTLKEVEFIAKQTKTLNEFGKETLSQSQVFLDLKNSGAPILLQTLKRKEKNWKVRYWACDMLGYVGDAVAEKELLALVSNQSQARLIRLRALDSILEIERRNAGIGKRELRTKLHKMTKKIKDGKVKRKIQKIVTKLTLRKS